MADKKSSHDPAVTERHKKARAERIKRKMARKASKRTSQPGEPPKNWDIARADAKKVGRHQKWLIAVNAMPYSLTAKKQFRALSKPAPRPEAK